MRDDLARNNPCDPHRQQHSLRRRRSHEFWPLDCDTLCVEKTGVTTTQPAGLMIETRRSIAKSLALLLLLPFVSLAQRTNWTASYKPCLNSTELRKTEHMSIGIRYDISDRIVIQQFHHAFDFWAKLLDADFHDEQSTSCAIAIVDATDTVLLHNGTIVARAQLPDRLNFQGWIAVDPRASSYLADDEATAIWIHEIGHLLGLKHNPSPTSIMFAIDVDGSNKLDSQDLRAIASEHALRPVSVSATIAGLLQ